MVWFWLEKGKPDECPSVLNTSSYMLLGLEGLMMGMEITTTGVMGFAMRINSFEDENNINNWEKNTVSYFMKSLWCSGP